MIGGRSPSRATGRRLPGDRRESPRGRGQANRRRRRRLPRRTVLALAAGLAIALVAGGGWLWLRDSPLVAVTRVTVTGQSGPDADQISSALTAAARNMTTLDVKRDQLRMAVVPYPVVKDLSVSTQFPHGMRIHVIEHIPVAVVSAGGQRIAVAGDGTLLRDLIPSAPLPTIVLAVVPGGSRLTGPAAIEARLLAAAPYPLLSQVGGVSSTASHGLIAQLRTGPSIYFGSAAQLGAKWAAAVAVLSDPTSDGAGYVDVTDPRRAAAGYGSDASGTAASGSASPEPSAATAAGSTGG